MCGNEAWTKNAPPPSLSENNTPLSLVQKNAPLRKNVDAPPPVLSVQNKMSPPQFTMNMQKKITTLKHVKIINPPYPQIVYTKIQLCFQENSLFITFVKKIWPWGMKTNSLPSVFEKKKKCVVTCIYYHEIWNVYNVNC